MIATVHVAEVSATCNLSPKRITPRLSRHFRGPPRSQYNVMSSITVARAARSFAGLADWNVLRRLANSAATRGPWAIVWPN